MFELFRDFRLGVKVALLGAGSVLITATALVFLAVWQSGQYNTLAQKEVDALIDADLNHITQGVYNLVRTENEAVQQQVDNNLNVALHVLANAGTVSLSEDTVHWTARNQFTNIQSRIKLPKMLIGGKWLGQNTDPGVKTVVVDEVIKLVGETATIFQCMNKSGDMIRVATTITDAEGKRAVGTYIPAVDASGKPNPVIAAILEGKNYHGRAFVVDAWYLTAYEPIKDKKGRLVGMLYVGVKQKTVELRIRQAILQTSVGKTGYVYVLGGKGKDRGRYIISQGGQRDGEDIWEHKDSDGRYIIQEIINKVTVMKPGKLTTERYRWQNPGETRPRWKIARLTYYEPWDWVIGASVYEDELLNYRAVLSGGRTRMTTIMGLAGLMITLLIGLVGIFMAWTIARPVRQLTKAAETIIHGDMNQVVDVHSRDEIGALARTFNIMTGRLRQTMVGLRESEEKYRTIIEQMEDGYFEVDLAGNFTFVNDAESKILGYSRNELIGMNHRQYQDKTNAEKAAQLFEKVYRTGEPVKGLDYEIIRKNGTKGFHEISVSLIKNTEGKPIGLRGLSRDVTERKRAEEEKKDLEDRLHRAEKMEALGQLAGGVAHDLNNVLGVLTGYSELLLMVIPEGHKGRSHAEKILLSTQKGAAIIQDLLTLARRGVMVSDVINFNDIVSGFLKTPVFEKIRDYHPWVTFRTECDQNLLNIKGSPIHLEKTLMNLVSNAAESISGQGEVTIRTQNRYMDKTICGYDEIKEGDYAVLTVSDTGMGIPAEHREKIFEPFYTKKTMGRSGTGLGLAIVWGTVKDLKGYIDVQTKIGEGTTFTIYFPATREELSIQQQKVPIEQYMGQAETVLVVDDIAEQREVASGLLTRLGYKVHVASSGEEAIEYLRSNTADILVLDMIMAPGIDGLETYQKILAINPQQKAILVSGFSETDRVRKAQQLGAGTYVKKPYVMEKIGLAIRDELNREHTVLQCEKRKD